MRWTTLLVVTCALLANPPILCPQSVETAPKTINSDGRRFWSSAIGSASPSNLSDTESQSSSAFARLSSLARSRAPEGSPLPPTNMIPGFAFRGSQQTTPIPTGVAVGDFNGDGKLDWVVASGDGTLWLYLGNGDGTSQSPLAIWPGGKLIGNIQDSNGQPGSPPVPVALAAASLRKERDRATL